MKLSLIVAIALLPLSACQAIEDLNAEADAEQQAADLSRCNGQGFTTGTDAMATCLATISRERQATSDRYAADRRAEEARKSIEKQSSSSSGGGGGGSYEGQTGFDPATANMSMCSDGALREDCSFAPNGY